jgi:hypothetical protein
VFELAFRRFALPADSAFKRFVLASVVGLVTGIGPAFCSAGSPPPASDAGTLTATGRVIAPGGAPSANAVICALGNSIEPGTTVHADADGRFDLRNVFGTISGIHARTADWRQQATCFVPPRHARADFQRPLVLQLAPAREQQVLVKSAGEPAAGVRVIAMGVAFKSEGITGPDGIARLWLPQGRVWNQIVAWDPKLGGAGLHSRAPSRPSGVVELSLLAPKPQTIRVVDQRRNPVANLRCSLVCETPSSFFWTDEFDEAIVASNSRGEVTIPWLPDHLSSVDLHSLGPDWKLDEAFMPAKVSTVSVRRRHAVAGRLLMPAGVSPEGILVNGNGFGSGERGDLTYARVRRDGTFTLQVAADHAYAFGISDDEWACDPWTGVVMASDVAEPARITLDAYRAIPLTVHLTCGPKAEPWTGVFVHARQQKRFNWTNSSGERQEGCGGDVESLGRVDADGFARFGMGRGQHELSFSCGEWRETRKLEIASNEPQSMSIHRPWKELNEIVGRLTHNGRPYRPTPGTAVRAWSVRSSFATPCEARLLPDGRFTAAAETESGDVYATDRANRLNAFRHFDGKDQPTGVELALVPTGIFSGQVVDEAGKPVAGARLRLVPKSLAVEAATGDAVLDETVCDNQGRFRFDTAPTGVLWPLIVTPSRDLRPPGVWSEAAKPFLLKPGGRREGERIQVAMGASNFRDSPSRQYESAADHLADLIRDAHALDLRVLVGAMGAATDPVEEAWHHFVDKYEFKESLRYLPLWIAAGDLRAQSGLFSQLKLRPPRPGEMLLVVLDGEGRQIDFLYLTVRGPSSIFKLGVNFLKKNLPPARDAQKLVAAARKQAEATGRRVWIVGASSRVEQSFQMVRWLQSQHALLERDYLVVILVEGCDQNFEEVWQSLSLEDGNEPWSAIVNAAGTVLARSVAPGDAAAAKRSLRPVLQKTAQKLTATDIDRLIQSFGE